MNFTSIDVVRHPLVQRIIDAYEKEDKIREEKRRQNDESPNKQQ